MNSTVNVSTPLTATSSMTTQIPSNNNGYHTVLLAIYSVVLLCGIISLSVMMHIMKSTTTSTMSIAVLNLIFTHFIFLLTVPFRIYYYADHTWSLNHAWCKMVSSMIHIHMYMSFIFYVIILISRLLAFYHRANQVASFQRMHMLLVSALVWTVVLVAVPCVLHFRYGQGNDMNNKSNSSKLQCFKFGRNIESAKVVNYIISTLIIVVAILLTALQANVLRILYRKHQQGCTSQQDFGAHLKSMCFALIMVVCFIPYHIFRMYYLTHVSSLEDINEVFLSLTTFNCLDMLTFLGRRTCSLCLIGRGI